MSAYHVADEAELKDLGFAYPDEWHGKVLVGPNDWYCTLGEPEDCSWYRDGSEVVKELNDLHALVEELKERVLRLEEQKVEDRMRQLEALS